MSNPHTTTQNVSILLTRADAEKRANRFRDALKAQHTKSSVRIVERDVRIATEKHTVYAVVAKWNR